MRLFGVPKKRPRRHRAIAFLFAAVVSAVLVPLGASHAAASSDNIFSPGATPVVVNGTDPPGIEVGVKFTSSVPGTVTGIRFYKGAGNGGTHIGHLWTTSGTLLGSATFANETASGWQFVNFATPVGINPNTVYIASYYAPQGHYSYSSQGFENAASSPPLTAVSNATSPNGVYLYTGAAGGGFPTSSYNATNYWVDVDFTPAQTPIVNLSASSAPTIYDGDSTTLSWSSSNAASCAATSPAGWTASTAPSGSQQVSPVTTTDYTMTCTGMGGGGSTSSTTTVTVDPAPAGTTTHLFSAAQTPSHLDSMDNHATTLGVGFQSSVAGYVTGIRFYKGNSLDGGTHTGQLWSSTGTLLAQARFTDETSYGWQDVTFSSPVAITANTPYVASYFAPLGRYPYDSGSDPLSLANAITDTPLQAPASGTGGNGVYNYGSTVAFPTQTYDASDYWVDVDFSTSATPTAAPQPLPRPGVRGSGPVLVLTDPTNPFSDDYCSSILETEGLPECAATDSGNLTSSFSLSAYRTIILADGAPLTTSQVSLITTWVNGGGSFIAMRPDDDLDTLLGIGRSEGSMSDAYYQVDPTRLPGIATQTLQYHGAADEHALAGAQEMATLYSSSSLATAFPAITTNTVGSGTAQAFMFDVSESVFYTRDGNPGLTGEVTNSTDGRDRINDRFGDGWLDTSKAGVPQADELERTLADLVEASTVPRLWYFPAYKSGVIDAVIVLTGDDHAIDSQTLNRFAAEAAASPAGCSVADWTCYTSTSYAYPGAFSDAAAKPYTDNGFEVGFHMADNGNCASDWNTAAQLDSLFSLDIEAWQNAYPTISAAYPPVTERLHCYGVWNDYASIPIVEAENGIKADTSSECWPNSFLNVGQCYITGTGMPEDYVDSNGILTGTYQFTTQATDENPSTITKAAMSSLIAGATGPNAYYGYYTVLCHLDNASYSNQCASDLLSIAETDDIPLVSAKQAETFWDGRNSATITNTTYGTGTLSFTVNAPVANIQEMTPTSYQGQTLTGITIDGNAATYTTQMVNGITYAMTTLPSGTSNLVATY